MCHDPMTPKATETQAARQTKFASRATDAFSGKFVLRLEPALHRRLAVKALAAGESLNSFCVDALRKA